MKKQNKFWNGRITGICGAGMQFLKAFVFCFLDRLSTYMMRPNLCSAGKGVVIQHGAVIRYPSQVDLGNDVRIGRNVEISSESGHGRLLVGNGTWIGRKCRLDFTGGLTIGKNCTLSENVTIFTHGHGLNPRSQPETKSLKIGDRVWIGANATILHNVSEIGDDSIVGAGSIVTESILPGVIVAGNPGCVIGEIKKESR